MTDDELPEWERILSAGPIPVTGEATADDLAAVIKPRLEALLRVYGAAPTAEGWRALAIGLAIAYERALSMRGVADVPASEPGRRGDTGRLKLGRTLLGQAEQTGLPMSAVIEAHRQAERKAGRRPRAASTLHEIVRDARKLGGNLADLVLRQKFEAAALRAATDLEDGHG
ncbi:hypothetical protein GJ689_10405 [Rhodoplanes serenus]|uniref:Uncharacterized protein n=1 Tax=Rhodoplanes serenus TaxID=200615 RepID=A0A9X4XQH0_9BRAD|nr:hypothetical protein [Rhodoplanes serenus]MTW16616.1 hypothetical protein [Rhodoplanes serenus]